MTARHGSSGSPRARAATAAAIVVALAACLWLARADAPSQAATPAGTSVIVLIGDGMGPAQRAATQLARYGLEVTQPMDALPVSGSIRTQSANSAITDSAAGATAIATGTKTTNGYVGVGPDGERLTTLLEIARDAGKSTGLVEDADVTNATTGSFAAHVRNRDQRRTIARQFLNDTKPDVILGGGEEYWCKRGTPGAIPNDLPEDRCRSKTNLIAEAQSLGYQYASDAESVAAATGPKLLGLVQRDPYVRELLADYDRKDDPHYVPEEALVAKAIEILSQDPDGFFLAIDVDEIDVGGHASHAGLVIKSADLLNRIVSTIESLPGHRSEPPGRGHRRPRDRRDDDRGPEEQLDLGARLPDPEALAQRAVHDRGHRQAVHHRLDHPGPHRGAGAADRGRARVGTPQRRQRQHRGLRRRQAGAHRIGVSGPAIIDRSPPTRSTPRQSPTRAS